MTVVIAAPIVLLQPVKQYVLTSPWISGLSFVTSFVLLLVLSFSETARHSHPINLLLLAGFTAAEGVLVGIISSQFNTLSVAMAVTITAGITVGLAVYALRTRTDFTTKGGLLVSLLLALILAGFLGIILRSPLLDVLISAGGAALFGAYIVFDVQMLAGGKHTSHQLSPDEYVAGAITIYLDIVNLFIYILRLVGERNN